MDATLKQHTPPTRPAPERLYDPIREELAAVEAMLKAELRHSHPGVDAMVRHAFRIGGKRLRPALLLLAAQAVGRVTPDHTTLAAVVEMVHTATLLHDDVLDSADTRRHLPTANARWGNHASVLAGDFLFTHAFYLASTLDTTYACQAIGRATNAVCEGEMLQVSSQGQARLTEDEYYRIIDAKTAALTACSSLLGAYYAGATESTVEALESYGRHLGRAFQIADDLLDVLGDPETVGKSLGTDLDQCKLTLPWIRMRDTLPDTERDDVLAWFTSNDPSDRAKLFARLAASDGIAYARTAALNEANQARASIERLSDSPATEVLRWLTDFVVGRNH